MENTMIEKYSCNKQQTLTEFGNGSEKSMKQPNKEILS